MRVTCPASMATSVPVPMAMPTSACGQRRRVVDAVAHHRHDAALALEPPDLVELSLRQHLGHDPADTHLRPDAFRRAPVVAGEHHDLDAHRSAAGRSPRRWSGLTGSAMRDESRGQPSPATSTTWTSGLGRRSALGQRRGDAEPFAASRRLPAATRGLPPDPHALARPRSRNAGSRQREAALVRGADDGLGQAGCSLNRSREAASAGSEVGFSGRPAAGSIARDRSACPR